MLFPKPSPKNLRTKTILNLYQLLIRFVRPRTFLVVLFEAAAKQIFDVVHNLRIHSLCGGLFWVKAVTKKNVSVTVRDFEYALTGFSTFSLQSTPTFAGPTASGALDPRLVILLIHYWVWRRLQLLAYNALLINLCTCAMLQGDDSAQAQAAPPPPAGTRPDFPKYSIALLRLAIPMRMKQIYFDLWC